MKNTMKWIGPIDKIWKLRFFLGIGVLHRHGCTQYPKDQFVEFTENTDSFNLILSNPDKRV